jgi:hypothetical protein
MSYNTPFSMDEQKYILKNRRAKSPATIAEELGEKYKQTNGGTRTREGVRDFLRDYDLDTLDATLRIPRQFKRRMMQLGWDNVDVNYIVEAALEAAIKVAEQQRGIKTPEERAQEVQDRARAAREAEEQARTGAKKKG